MTVLRAKGDLTAPDRLTHGEEDRGRRTDEQVIGQRPQCAPRQVARIEIREFDVDWGVPANTTFGGLTTLTPSAFSSDICAGSNLFNYCIDQPGSVDLLVALSV